MIRTRDFVLVFSAIMFLLTAIGGTIFGRLHTNVQTASVIEFVTDTREEFSAEVPQSEIISREDRLVSMRQKIAASEAQPWLEVESEPIISEVTASDEDKETEQNIVVGISKCPDFFTYRGVWTPQEIQSSVSEGARIFYREVTVSAPLDSTASLAELQQEVVLQLPLYPLIKTQSSCLSSDVVGVAQDGSLIRHNESGLYSVFGESTLIGYALDGFPIYGITDVITDECGGVLLAGEYRYHLSDKRDSVLQCFRASPTSL